MARNRSLFFLHSLTRCIGFTAYILFSVTAKAGPDFTSFSLEDLSRVNIFAANILSAHVHNKNQWMLSINSMRMSMDGNLDGTDNVSDNAVTNPSQYGFMVAPTKMDMNMTMLHAMYSPTNNLTIMAMLPYIKNEMSHVRRDGIRFKTAAQGWGDLEVKANYILHQRESSWGEQSFFLTTGVSVPTGSINAKDHIPMMGMPGQVVEVRLPYSMQTGSGTYDLIAGLGYLGIAQQWYWGVQGLLETPLNSKNDHGYRVGDEYTFNGWLTRAWTNRLSTTLRLEGKSIDDIHGADPLLTPMVVPTADPDLRAQKIVSLYVSTEWALSESVRSAHKLHIEVGKPFYQDLDGPQLETGLMASFAWVYKY